MKLRVRLSLVSVVFLLCTKILLYVLVYYSVTVTSMRLSQRTLQTLRSARNNVQQTARRCAHDYWQQLCESIQRSADIGNIRGMYDGIKKAMGSTQNKTVPLKSSTGQIIHDKAKQMERWVEHYSDLYS